jgi:hypothetical protein
MEIKKVFKRKDDGVKLVCIPKHSDIDSGDYVKIIKIEDQEVSPVIA